MRSNDAAAMLALFLCLVGLSSSAPLVNSRRGEDFWTSVVQPVARRAGLYNSGNQFKTLWPTYAVNSYCPFNNTEAGRALCELKALETCPWDGHVCTCQQPHSGGYTHLDGMPSQITVHTLNGTVIGTDTLVVDMTCGAIGEVGEGPGNYGRRHVDRPEVFWKEGSVCTYTPQIWTNHFWKEEAWASQCYVTPAPWNRTCTADRITCGYSTASECEFKHPPTYPTYTPYVPDVSQYTPTMIYTPRTCPILANSTGGTWSYVHYDGFGLDDRGGCGSTAVLNCDPCYSLANASIQNYTCDGVSWLGEAPSCQITVSHCNASEIPAVPANGYIQGSGNTCGANRTYHPKDSCWSANGPTITTCQVNGTWSPMTATYGLNYCDTPTPVANAIAWKYTHYSFSQWHNGTTLSTHTSPTCGTDILTSCDYCYEQKSGDMLRSCMAGSAAHEFKHYNGTQPTCGPKEAPPLPDIVDGHWVYNHNQYGSSSNLTNGTVVEVSSCGTTATVVCRACYCPHHGNVTRSCSFADPVLGTDGPLSWDGISPQCIPTKDWCPGQPPAAPPLAVQSTVDATCEKSVDYDCKPCYAKGGSAFKSTCGIDTLWTPITDMHCTLIECQLMDDPANTVGWTSTHGSYTGTTLGQTFTDTLGSGAYRATNSILTCGSSVTTACATCHTHTAGDLTRTCGTETGVGLFSGVDPTCQLNTCPVLPAVANGIWSFAHTLGSDATPSCGTVATLTCDVCYELDTAVTATATRSCDGVAFDGVQPVCKKVPDWCPPANAPAAPTFGVVAGTETTCGAKRTYSCDTCYGRDAGTYESECKSASSTATSGSWTPITGQCTLVKCPAPAAVTDSAGWTYTSGTHGVAPATLSCAAEVKTTCDRCYNVSGNLVRTCVVNETAGTGDFDGTQPTCTLKTCSTLPAVANGMWAYEHPYRGTDSAPSCDSRGFLTCDDCYEHTAGDLSRTCDGTGWNGTMPVCTKKLGWCTGTPPATPLNALMIGNAADNRCGDTRTYECKPCYDQVGTKVSTCDLVTRQWTAINTQCTLSECATPVLATQAHPWATTHSSYSANVPNYTSNPVVATLGRAATQFVTRINTCGTSMTTTCKYCHKVASGSLTRTCNVTNKQFEPAQPVCVLKTAAALAPVPNGYWSYVHGPAPSGGVFGTDSAPSCHTVATLSCDPCFKIEGNGGYPSSNFDGDAWSHDPANLKCVGLDNWCTDPEAAAPDHGSMTGSGAKCGATRNYTCDECYVLNIGQTTTRDAEGNRYVQSTCQNDRKWSYVDVSCHPRKCPSYPPQVAHAAAWAVNTTASSATTVQCGAKVEVKACDSCYRKTSGAFSRTCQTHGTNSNTNTHAVASGGFYTNTNPVCTLNTCPAVPAVANGGLTYTHASHTPQVIPQGYNSTYQLPLGFNSTGSCGSKLVIRCDACYRVQWTGNDTVFAGYTATSAAWRNANMNGTTGWVQHGNLNWADTLERTCDGVSWSGEQWALADVPTCVIDTSICDANAIDLNTKTGMTATYQYTYAVTNNSTGAGAVCGDNVTLSCPRCANMTITTYPNPNISTIVRTCQANGTWSGEGDFDCSNNNYQGYTYNMLLQERDVVARTGYSEFSATGAELPLFQLSPYECKNNMTLCTNCQANINDQCKARLKESEYGQDTTPGKSVWYTWYHACKNIAKNKCPRKCNGTICEACRLDEPGLTFCAASGRCLCNSTAGYYGNENDNWGDGCEKPVLFYPQTYLGDTYDGKLFPWWVFIVLGCGICFGFYLAVHCYSQECGKGGVPVINDICHGGDSCWYNCWYYHWYYFLCGCFCAGESRRPGENGSCAYQLCYFIYRTLLCGCFCTPEQSMEAGAGVEKDEYGFNDGLEMKKSYPRGVEGSRPQDSFQGALAAPGGRQNERR